MIRIRWIALITIVVSILLYIQNRENVMSNSIDKLTTQSLSSNYVDMTTSIIPEHKSINNESNTFSLIGTALIQQGDSYAILMDKKCCQILLKIGERIEQFGQLIEIKERSVMILNDLGEQKIISSDNLVMSECTFVKDDKMMLTDNYNSLSTSDSLNTENQLADDLKAIIAAGDDISLTPYYEKGVLIGLKFDQVDNESIFSKIGLKENDIITRINKNQIKYDPIALAENLVDLKENEKLTIGLIRDGMNMIFGISKTNFNETILWPELKGSTN